MRKKVGTVSEDERNEVQLLFERHNGLTELAKILTPENKELYEKLVADLGETTVKLQNWWNRMSQEYNWERDDNGHWEINFESCDILLVAPD
jgi:CXXX repeat modification system protein